MYKNIVFLQGNPYITKTKKEFYKILLKYELVQKSESTYIAYPRKEKPTTYLAKKAIIQNFAIDYSYILSELNLSYGEIAEYQEFFTQYGKKYGLLKEFKENAIC